MTRIFLLIVIVSSGVLAQDARWPTAAKNGFGTSTTLQSKVWFTLANGVMTEVFYPTIDSPKVKTLQLLVHIGARVESELDDTFHRMELPHPASLTFRQVNTGKSSHYTITKTYITDPRRNTLLIEVQFDSLVPARLSADYVPSANNRGNSALVSTCGSQPRAKLRCTIALGFGENTAESTAAAHASLARGFAPIRDEYEAGWQAYVATLPHIAKHQRQFNMAAMVLKGLEDKTFRGAVIASPSTPWGGGANADESTVSGYHVVWARDLYHVATAFDAIGDRAAANRTLDYLFRVQQKADGSFPQNSWVDERPIGNGLQMDQVALPLVLAYQLQRNDRSTWLKHIKPAADFVVRRGPRTDQDRWEEKPGYSPATIASEIAGLVCAAEIAKVNGDQTSAKKYLETADNWAQNVERWTVTKSGNEAGYFLRITENDNPNDGATLQINSSDLVVDERKIVDAGFLELIRLGVKRADDRMIVESLALIDQLIKVETPLGAAWYRYNHDAYGETPTGGAYDGRNGVGRLWTLLTGERGEYEIAAGDVQSARKRLDTMAAFANDGLMIPEQVWDRTGPGFQIGRGTGSATPLAWSMAQFIRLAMSIEKGRNVETPRVVVERYVSHAKAQSRKENRNQF
ncbi:MAG TPA: glycoside hydrolase family 15 protein [Pyrinomonadaceae bacterium]|nr:glycoside hydrolase family 15 protein [Pyrinomonadaceae bacterium]